MIAPSMAIAAIGGPDGDGERDRERRNGDHHAPCPQADRLVAHLVVDQSPTAGRPKPQRVEGRRGEQEVAGIEQRCGALIGEVTVLQGVAEHTRREGQDRHDQQQHQVEQDEAVVDAAQAAEDAVVVEPDNSDVGEREQVADVDRPLLPKAMSEASRPASCAKLENEQGDR
jgi:hypothetical protein